MFQEDYQAAAGAAQVKSEFLRHNPFGFLLASILAGVYVGFGALLVFSIGAPMADTPFVKLVMGAAFGIALSLVLMAGAELFTGNNLTVCAGMLKREISVRRGLMLWLVCYLGNWLGGILLGLAFVGTGLATGTLGSFIAASSLAKMGAGPLALFLRGVLCNTLVCLAVWCALRAKSESGKLIMAFWCLFAFVSSGFEHSVANMTLLTVAVLSPSGAAVTLGGYFYNILVVSLGNMAGGILCVALPYYAISRR